MVRGLLGRRAGRLLAACVLTCTAACITAVSVAAFAPAAPAPASGAGSITRIRLGSAQMQAQCITTFAIGPHGGAEDLEVGPSGLPWFSYGSTPWGVGEVEPGPIAKVHGWNYFYNPTTMVLGADGRMWMAWSQLNLPGLYGYYDTATQSATMFFMPSTSGGLFAMAAGANGTIDITAQDSYLYVVQTGATTSLSTIATSLPTPAEAFASVAVVAAGAAISIGAILFITFPSQLYVTA